MINKMDEHLLLLVKEPSSNYTSYLLIPILDRWERLIQWTLLLSQLNLILHSYISLCLYPKKKGFIDTMDDEIYDFTEKSYMLYHYPIISSEREEGIQINVGI